MNNKIKNMTRKFIKTRSLLVRPTPVLLTLACFCLLLCFNSCKKDKNENTTEYDGIPVSSHFYQAAIDEKNLAVVSEISSFLSDLKIRQYSNIQKMSRKKISFRVSQKKNNLYINSERIEINNLTFYIERQGDFFTIFDNSSTFQVSYNSRTGSSIIKAGNHEIDYQNLTEADIESIKDIKKYPLYLALLIDFTSDSIPRKDMSMTTLREADKYEGTGIGFHKSRANAEYFCNRDYKKILADHPTWHSPGVSISCLLDNHVCVCTADFYS